MFTVAASYNITYAPYVSDYSRYLPRDTPTGKIIASVFWGAAGSPIWLIPLGAWMATRLGVEDALVGIHDAGNNVVGGLGSILAILSVLALVATMGLNAYSGMLTVVTAVDAFRPVRPTRQLRVVTIVVLAVIWLVGGLALTNAVSSLNNALLGMLYLLAPWTAINLLDFFLLRHGHYAITDLFTPNGIYGTWNRFGVTAYLVAILVEIPFALHPRLLRELGRDVAAGRRHLLDPRDDRRRRPLRAARPGRRPLRGAAGDRAQRARPRRRPGPPGELELVGGGGPGPRRRARARVRPPRPRGLLRLLRPRRDLRLPDRAVAGLAGGLRGGVGAAGRRRAGGWCRARRPTAGPTRSPPTSSSTPTACAPGCATRDGDHDLDERETIVFGRGPRRGMDGACTST